jgi:type IV pilus assembly protein PilB
MGVEPFLIGSSVIGVVAQRLVRVICPSCKSPYKPGVDELAPFGLADKVDSIEFYHGRGCSHCDGTGYQGRAAVAELLTISDDIRKLVLTRPSSVEVKELAMSQGMISMKQNAIDKLLRGVTTVEEVRKRIYVADDVE